MHNNLDRHTALFSLSPLAIALALALNSYPLDVEANTYEYTGKWVANDILPSNPPFLQGTITEKNSSGTVLSETEFSYSEPIPGTVLSPYGFREGQDWSFLWAGSTFEEVYELNKEMFDLYGITATNYISPNVLYLDGSLKGGTGHKTIIDVPSTFNEKEQNNSLCIVLPVTAGSGDSKIGSSLVNNAGAYQFNTDIVSVNYGNDENTPTSTSPLLSLGVKGTQNTKFTKLGWNGAVFEKFVTDSSVTYQPHQNVLFMRGYIRSPGSNAIATQMVSGKVGAISTADDHVPGSVTLFKEDGWHIDQTNIKVSGILPNTFARPVHNTNGISMYGGGMANSFSNFSQNFKGEIQSLGTSLHPLGIGIISALDNASGTNKFFTQDIGKVNEIHAVMAGIVNDIRATNFTATQEQNVEVGKIEVFGDGTFRGAIGVYNRTNTGGTNSSANAVQKILISDSIVVDGYSVLTSPHQYLEVVSTFAAIANRGGRQEIVSTNRVQPILLSAKTQMKDFSSSESPYGTYSLLVYPNFSRAGGPFAYTETTLKGSFDVYNGDIAAFGEQSGRSQPSVSIRLEGQLYCQWK